jgi:hypothetical protein
MQKFMHALHEAPIVPQAALVLPGWQEPVLSQQPILHVLALHPPPPESPPASPASLPVSEASSPVSALPSSPVSAPPSSPVSAPPSSPASPPVSLPSSPPSPLLPLLWPLPPLP